MDWPITNDNAAYSLIAAAIGIVSYASIGSIWNIYSARGQGVKLAHRGLYWICKWLAKQGMTTEDIDHTTLGNLKIKIGTKPFEVEEK